MKLLLKNLIIVLISIVIISSCKKNDSIQDTISTKVKTYIEEVTNFSTISRDTFNVSYDANNRVVSLISTFSGSQFLYNYVSNSNYIFEIKNGPHLIIHEISYLSSDLLVDSAFQYNDTNDSTTMKFIYNSNKQIVEQKAYDYSLPNGAVLFRRHTYSYNTQGDVLSDTELGSSGNINSISSYTYTNFTSNNFSLATIYHPPLYKKLPETITVNYPGSGTVISNFTYVFDNYNRVIKETQVNSGGNSAIKQYVYY